MRLALLQWFLNLLEFTALMGDFYVFATSPMGLSIGACGISYQLLLFSGCDPLSSAVLAIAIALCAHTVTQRPEP